MTRNLFAKMSLLYLFLTIVRSAPLNPPVQVQPKYQVASEKFHQEPNLEYTFEQEFTNGEKFAEDGKLKTVNGMNVIVTKGSYTINNPDGTETIVNYTADEEGFHPEIITPTSG
ncbi:Cuticle protein CP14.6 [Pseudolycoriella hygida]|uniref:Cuticle protein CP14.6 n=1 Tax=Pseudolycoriella hygida TaxID=35572 RepID=A0A9Q0MVI7_9DIPT|nr:Cuticle protein CP14.6 [Pseudolycoriella hygida]